MPWRLPRRCAVTSRAPSCAAGTAARHASGSRACFARSGSGRHYTTSISACSRRAADWLLNEEPDHAPGDLRGSPRGVARLLSQQCKETRGYLGSARRRHGSQAVGRLQTVGSKFRGPVGERPLLHSPSCALCQEHEVDVVIPTIDPELLPLSQARKEFERLHVYLLSRIRSRFPSPATSASSRSACSPPAFWRPGRRR